MRATTRALLTLGLLAGWACTDLPTEPVSTDDPFDLGELQPSLNVVSGLPAVCGTPTVTPLLVGGEYPIGSVEVVNDQSNLYVVFETEPAWRMIATAVWVGSSPSDIPLLFGFPRVGRFPHRSSHRWVNEVVWQIPLDAEPGEEIVVVAFASALGLPAWGAGPEISSSPSRSMYFTHTVSNCAAATVGPTGGSLSTPDGNASLSIPSGALSAPVDITIDPATVEEILDHIAGQGGGTGASAAATMNLLPPINGVTPIAESLWDFGPDGLQFNVPITVVLHYDDANLPAGVDESQLAVFVINGIFFSPPSVVDPIANTVTAMIDHFSYAFIGVDEPDDADLAVTNLVESADVIELGQTVTYTATLSNLGPTDIADGLVSYQGFGNVAAGPLSPGCTENPAPIFATVVIDCVVGAVPSGGFVVAPPASFAPQTTGADFEVWVDPSSASTNDPVSANNRATETYDVVAPSADLEIQNIFDSPDPSDPGENVTYTVAVVADAAQTVAGATLLLDFSDADFVSASDPACFATLLGVTCPLPPLPDGLIHGVDITLLPDEGLTELSVTARINAPVGTTDPDAANNIAHEMTTIGGGTADLSVSSLVKSADVIELGQTVTYTATLRNFGPHDIMDGVVFYQAFGNVAAAPLSPGCTENTAPPLATVQIECVVGAVSSGGVALAPSASFVPQTTGVDFEVWADPGSASTNDPVLPNNRATQTYDVVATSADLEIQNISDAPDPADAGENVTYTVDVTVEAAQTVTGATLLLSFSDASFVSASEPACFATQLGVTCPLPPLPDGLIHGVEITLLPDASLTELTVDVQVDAPAGTTDPDLANNTATETTTIGDPGSADLFIQAGGPGSITLGDQATYAASIFNLGPDPVADATVIYRILGDAVAGPLQPGCTETSDPAEADIEIVCAVGAVDMIRPGFASASFEPQALGDYTVRIVAGSSVPDPNAANNQFETTLAVVGPQPDLRVVNFHDDRDPILAGGGVTYEVDVRLEGTMPSVDGAVLRILFNGDANLISSTSACGPIAGGVSCPLPTLTLHDIHSVDVTMTLPTAGDITAEATIDPPAGVTDLNPANNTLQQTTTVGALPQPTIAIGEIVEAVSPAGGDTTWYAFELTTTQDVRFHISLLPGSFGSAQIVIDLVGDTLPPFFPGAITQGRALDGLSGNVVVSLLAASYRVGVTSSGAGQYRLGIGTDDGRLDQSFGPAGSGFAFGPFNSGNPFRQMELVGDATLVVGDEHLIKFDADGELDASFGTNGIVDLNALFGGFGTSLAVQPDGKIVVASFTTVSPRPWVIARFDAGGALDPTFGTGGIVEIASFGNGSASRPLGVGFQQNGADLDIVVAGAGDPQNNLAMVRLDPDGSVDTGFGTNGIVFEGVGFTPDAVEMQPDGRIVILDSRQIMRYTADGARDATFGTNGLVDLGIAGGAQGVTVLPDGDLLVLGILFNEALVIRLTPSGALDASFAGGGLQTYHFGHREMFKAAAVTPAGDLILVGHQRTIDDGWEFLIAKMSQDGVIDSNFGVAGYTIEGHGDEARAVLFDSMGRFLVGGQQLNGNRIELSRHFLN